MSLYHVRKLKRVEYGATAHRCCRASNRTEPGTAVDGESDQHASNHVRQTLHQENLCQPAAHVVGKTGM
jgi:hypothetical protein